MANTNQNQPAVYFQDPIETAATTAQLQIPDEVGYILSADQTATTPSVSGMWVSSVRNGLRAQPYQSSFKDLPAKPVPGDMSSVYEMILGPMKKKSSSALLSEARDVSSKSIDRMNRAIYLVRDELSKLQYEPTPELIAEMRKTRQELAEGWKEIDAALQQSLELVVQEIDPEGEKY